MSEESAPKLRLKPKLVSDPAVPPPQPAGSAPVPGTPPVPTATPAADEPKLVRLKPRLSAQPMPEPAPAPAPAPEPVAAEISAPVAELVAPEPPPAEAPAAEKPVVKFSLKPKGASAAPILVPAAAPAPAEAQAPDATTAEPPPLSEPVPAPVMTDTGEEGEPAEITAIRKASGMPFPPPPGKFPPPGAAKPAPPWAKPAPAKGSKNKLILMGGGALAVLLVFGGAFYAYKKLTAEPPPKPKLAAKPTTPQGQAVAAAKAAVEKAKEQAAAPVNEVLQADQATPVPATVKPVETPAPIAVAPVVEPPPPPPASVAFKAWVENLKIGGVSVRAGKPVRITIGRTAYVTGDLVNPQLGITFESYKTETRMLIFSDKTGAKVERRN